MLQTYLLIHNLFFFSLIILYHVFILCSFQCVRSIYYSLWESIQDYIHQKLLFVCGKFFYKDIIILLFFHSISLHDNHFLTHKRFLKNNKVYWYFMYVLIMNLLLEEKTLTSHSFERYCIFYGSLMNLFQKVPIYV